MRVEKCSNVVQPTPTPAAKLTFDQIKQNEGIYLRQDGAYVVVLNGIAVFATSTGGVDEIYGVGFISTKGLYTKSDKKLYLEIR
jgi:hypothetical protein